MARTGALDRRALLVRTGAALVAGGFVGQLVEADEAVAAAPLTWPQVRAQFRLERGVVHLGGLLLASHPAVVRAAIERHRNGLDRNPVHYLHEHQSELEARVVRAAAAYFGANPADLALTDSTTMGLGLLYNGVRLARGDEILTSSSPAATSGCSAPRGTGVVWGRGEAWNRVDATIPSFTPGDAAATFTPGCFHSFEHRWALAEAFDLHRSLGRARVEARIHDLATHLKDGLAAMKHVTVYTPRSPTLSAGIVCFDVDGYAASEVVDRLARKRVTATVTPYATQYARLAAGLFNTTADVDAGLAAVRGLG